MATPKKAPVLGPVGVTVESPKPTTLAQLNQLTGLLNDLAAVHSIVSDDVHVHHGAGLLAFNWVV